MLGRGSPILPPPSSPLCTPVAAAHITNHHPPPLIDIAYLSRPRLALSIPVPPSFSFSFSFWFWFSFLFSFSFVLCCDAQLHSESGNQISPAKAKKIQKAIWARSKITFEDSEQLVRCWTGVFTGFVLAECAHFTDTGGGVVPLSLATKLTPSIDGGSTWHLLTLFNVLACARL